MSDLHRTRTTQDRRAPEAEPGRDERPQATRFGRDKSRLAPRPKPRARADVTASGARDAADDELVFEDDGGL